MCNQILTVCRLPTVLAEKFSATFSHRSSERISCKVTPIVWQVIDDQTSDSPKSWAKTLKDTNVGTLLDHEIFKKGSNKICAKIFSYARPSAAFQGPCPECSIPPPRGGHGQNARDWRGLARPGGQEAGAGLPRAPAPLVPASPSRTRAPAPLFRVHARRAVPPPPGAVTGKKRGTGGDWRCTGGRRPGRTCPEPPRP